MVEVNTQHNQDPGKQPTQSRTIITSALPYANGSIHIGHLVEYIQTDILVRFLKLLGEEVLYCCADDTHGAPIEIKASQLGITPEQMIAKYHEEHLADFQSYNIHFDSYYTTNSPENKEISSRIFLKLKEKGLIYQKDMELTYCPHDNRFLPDRYVKGECPKCHAKDQYGDVCEVCDTAYKTTDLLNPYCTLCKNPPVRKISKHYFFKLSEFSEQLKDWLTNNKHLQPEIRNQILNWVTSGLEDWCISRDGPYFGFKIPGEESKYFYVWLDAPIGYISSFAHKLGKGTTVAVEEWDKSRIIHVIGKDIIYFHLLFWPAVLMGSGIRLPENVLVHGFLNVNGEKMSKSRGTFLTAREFLDLLPGKNPELLRYYYAANLGRNMTDINLDMKDFTDRVNNELVSNIANFFYRTLSFLEKHFEGTVPKLRDESVIALEEAKKIADDVKISYHDYDFRNAVKGILSFSSLANKHFQDNQPWKLVKEDKERAGHVLAVAANLAKDLAILLKPMLPETCKLYEQQLNLKGLTFADLDKPLQNHKLGTPAIILQKIPEVKIGLQENAKQDANQDTNKKEKETPKQEGDRRTAETGETADAIDTSLLLNLKVAKIAEVRRHPNAEKLYIEQLDTGYGVGVKRQILSGLVPYYKEEELVGKSVVLVSNLKPAKLRGIESNGMLLAAEEDGAIGILVPHADPGTQVTVEGVHGIPNTSPITHEQFQRVDLQLKDGTAYCNGHRLIVNGHPIHADPAKKVQNGKIT